MHKLHSAENGAIVQQTSDQNGLFRRQTLGRYARILQAVHLNLNINWLAFIKAELKSGDVKLNLLMYFRVQFQQGFSLAQGFNWFFNFHLALV